MDKARVCVCGVKYWPRQAWVHKGHGVVVDAVEGNGVVVDAPKAVVVDAVPMVVDRKKDRHVKTEARREYLKMKKRESRKRKVVA